MNFSCLVESHSLGFRTYSRVIAFSLYRMAKPRHSMGRQSNRKKGRENKTNRDIDDFDYSKIKENFIKNAVDSNLFYL